MKNIFSEIATWIDNGDFLYKRFAVLSRLLERYIIHRVLVSKEAAETVARSFSDVLSRCDKISYEEPGQVPAYAILHFLDRYHRFQLILREAIHQRFLPLPKDTLRVLDVGTGPGPALFALSDIYALIDEFAQARDLKTLTNVDYRPDYAELSQAFRQWLHHFTEFVNENTEGTKWVVPYHTGSFTDFHNIEFNRYESKLAFSSERGLSVRLQKRRYRFNVVILSNFITTEDAANQYREQLYQSALFLRNRGLLLVVGAPSNLPKYKNIYVQVKEAIEGGRYTNWKFIGSCKEKPLETPFLCYSSGDRFGNVLKGFTKRILDRMSALDTLQTIPEGVRGKLERFTMDSSDHKFVWENHAFIKRSRLQPREKKRRANKATGL
jgi:SAM-dependent methyltransferase